MKFEFEHGTILVDGDKVSQAEIMDILVSQQRKIWSLEDEIDGSAFFYDRASQED